MSTAKRVLKNFLSLSVAQIITKALGIFVTAYLARTIKAEGLGKIGFALAIVAYFTLFVDLGLSTFGVREIARSRDKIKKYVNNILTIRLVASIIGFISILIFAYFIPKSQEIKYLIIFFGLNVFAISFNIGWVFQGIEKMELQAVSEVIQQIVYAILIFLIIKSPDELLKIPFISIGTVFLSTIILVLIFVKKFGIVRMNFDFPFWRKILKQSLPMWFMGAMATIHLNFDFIMLGFMKSEEVVGWYSAAYKIVLLVGMLRVLTGRVFLPPLSRTHNDKSKLENVSGIYSRIMFGMSIPIGLGGTILAPYIIKLIYGKGFSESVLPFQILIWSIVIAFFCAVYSNSLLAWNREKKVMAIVGIGAVTNIIFNFILIPKFSLIGAAVATVVAEFTIFFGAYLEFQKIIKAHFVKHLLRPCISSVIMSAALLLLIRRIHMSTLGILTLFFLGLIIYSATLFLLKGFTIKDFGFIFRKKA